ncbi:uncharacterized protein [Drosophila tropicalis]|uniref:uncharacterized protein n=1 Tax=Drosophila tropicalis TaxID=46794 RepID=UPI0035AC0FB2
MYSTPQQESHQTQTVPQPNPHPVCVPLLMVDEDGKKRYCYHGGKCRCENCAKIRQQQKDELDRQLFAYIEHDRLKLEPSIRQVRPRQYRLEATRTSPEMGMRLLKDHEKLRAENPLYYLPYKYYMGRNAWRVPGPQHVGTQTDIRIGSWGIEGCPCADKTACWDI